MAVLSEVTLFLFHPWSYCIPVTSPEVPAVFLHPLKLLQSYNNPSSCCRNTTTLYFLQSCYILWSYWSLLIPLKLVQSCYFPWIYCIPLNPHEGTAVLLNPRCYCNSVTLPWIYCSPVTFTWNYCSPVTPPAVTAALLHPLEFTAVWLHPLKLL